MGPHTPPPTDHGKLSSKRHAVTNAQGIPVIFYVTSANQHDSLVIEALVDTLPAVAGKSGRPRRWPSKLHADKGYDFKRCRAHLRQRGMIGRIARQCIESSERLGKHRWVVERTHRWFAGFGKLQIRFERRLDIHEALLKLTAAFICAHFVDRWC